MRGQGNVSFSERDAIQKEGGAFSTIRDSTYSFIESFRETTLQTMIEASFVYKAMRESIILWISGPGLAIEQSYCCD